mmetsp:Transcript_33951/g.52909  ORF Transcript_33951/g.52909 Transcript_33951/m.52909 type:complete len:163 (+) Transcript_33951:21-509(+)|eukprot:CAMPEP_0184291256 /NCGR_PEP_ID=MMETSP1049-20130417/3328_1 /TAXON_ID=77928 /ORGANISM="Proteomonas sulcata, Strain CCMP704" /LENGTH=162 /DNA_ID=CAMNT_0026598653 /DNA_START=13 /DNA_END=501 /DNA_ORIENTATION=+
MSYGAVSPQRSAVHQRRYVGVAALAASAALLGCLALGLSHSSKAAPSTLMTQALSALPFFKPSVHAGMSHRARMDLDPGSLNGLLAAANGEDMYGDASRTTKLGDETAADELASLQERETTQSDVKSYDETTPSLKQSLGKTIAQYFTTVRSVKDDQGTFLG